jgi:HDIG domain protein
MKISLCTYQSLMKEGRTMETGLTREEALQALQTYNHEPFHLQHALTVEAIMGWFAKEEGFEAESDFWRMAGLLHDIDFEQWPEQHCVKCIELLQSAHATPELIHAVCCHGYGICTDVEPTLQMEKILFAADELTGLIGAAAKMRPSKSCTDMELSSLKKKFKDKKFAAGCSRDVIRVGAERLGWTLDELLEKTLHAMADTESTVAEELNLLLQA